MARVTVSLAMKASSCLLLLLSSAVALAAAEPEAEAVSLPPEATPPACNTSEMSSCWPRFAGGGVAFDCMKVKMLTPYAEKYTPGIVRRGAVTCTGDNTLTASLGLFFIALLVAHLSLLLAPVALIPLVYTFLQKAGERASQIKAPAILLASFGAFGIASLGEIAVHIQQQWLYLGSYPSYYNVVFYAGLSYGETLLAWGLGGWDSFTAFNLSATTAAAVLLSAAVTCSNAVPDAQATAPKDLPKAFGSCTLSSWKLTAVGKENASLCKLGDKVGGFQTVQILQFVVLGICTFAFLRRAWQRLTQVPVWGKGALVLCICVAYVGGFISAFVIECTGNQKAHLATASSFLAGFLLQIAFILLALDPKLLPGLVKAFVKAKRT